MWQSLVLNYPDNISGACTPSPQRRKATKQPRKATNEKHSKTKLLYVVVAFYDTRPGNEMGLFHTLPSPQRGVRWTQAALSDRAFTTTALIIKFVLDPETH